MSLRLRLVGVIALSLAVSLAAGGSIAWLNARHSVATELEAAFAVGRQTLAAEIAKLAHSREPERDLDDLVTAFRGNRHLRVSLIAATDATPSEVERPPRGQVPDWFVRLIGTTPQATRLPVTIDGRRLATVAIETDPHNEVLEIWNEFSDSLLVVVLFSGLATFLVWLSLGRALRPLARLAAAFRQIGAGDYAARVEGRLPRELAPLVQSFDRMARQLALTHAENRRLNERLLTLQDEERALIARDLHDEVGPFLFAVGLDAASVTRLAQGQPSIDQHARSIGEAVRHMQGLVKGMLARLRPIGLAEFGLAAAIGNLVDFWQARHPDIDFAVSIAPGCAGCGALVEETAYRIVQEGLANAVRHGRPRRIAVRLAREPGDIPSRLVVAVEDDGSGLPDPPQQGFGLLGMSERVRALGGSLALAPPPGGGLRVTAELPLSGTAEAASRSEPAAAEAAGFTPGATLAAGSLAGPAAS